MRVMNPGNARKLIIMAMLVPLALSLLAAPTMGATKIVNTKVQNVTFTLGPFVSTICGVTDALTLDLRTKQLHSVEWDNGHITIKVTSSVRVFDSSGRLLGKSSSTFSQVRGEGSLPLTIQTNNVFTCAGASATPGKLSNTHLGLTIGEDGLLKEFHFVSN